MSTSPYQYMVIFHEYQPYYHYTTTQQGKKKQHIGFLPAGVDFTYRNKRVSTITMMQLLHATIMTDTNIRRLRTILLQELPQSPLPKIVLYKMQQQLLL